MSRLKAPLLLLVSVFFVGCFQTPSTSEIVGRPDNSRDELAGESDVQSYHVAEVGARGAQFAPVVKRYASRFGVDWVLVLAVMQQESQFNKNAMSHRGAFGLMQIMPQTRLELEERLGVDETLTPGNNIKAGIYHLKRLSKSFSGSSDEDRTLLTLAAYNAGLARIKDAQALAAHLGEDPDSWKGVRAALPLLSRRYYTLHQQVWPEGQPKAGTFSDWKQTVGYVDRIAEYYEHYDIAMR
jgi:membrane-bound lytic murein transglycosylase F